MLGGPAGGAIGAGTPDGDAGAGRAGGFGIAAGVGSGFVAVIIKAMADALAVGGLGEVFATWQSYLLIPVAPVAFWTLQSGLRAGRLLRGGQVGQFAVDAGDLGCERLQDGGL